MKALRYLMFIFTRRNQDDNTQKTYLTKDKEKREEAEARLKAVEVLVDVQTRRRGQQRGSHPHH